MAAVDRDTIARHEAGHAVMRRLCGLSATRVCVDDGGGETAGTGRSIKPQIAVHVLLAGIAAELGLAPVTINWARTRSEDVDRAREILERFHQLRMFERAGSVEALTVDQALSRHYETVCELLQPYQATIDDLAFRLDRDGYLSARPLAEYFRRIGLIDRRPKVT